jgi:hypothetical protein
MPCRMISRVCWSNGAVTLSGAWRMSELPSSWQHQRAFINLSHWCSNPFWLALQNVVNLTCTQVDEESMLNWNGRHVELIINICAVHIRPKSQSYHPLHLHLDRLGPAAHCSHWQVEALVVGGVNCKGGKKERSKQLLAVGSSTWKRICSLPFIWLLVAHHGC